jgi:uncharacterized protein
MEFNVASLVHEAIGATRDFDLDAVLDAPGQELERVKGRVRLMRTPAGVLVRARLTMVEPENCSRCLRPLEELVEVNFEEEFQCTVDARSGQTVPRAELDPDAFLIDDMHVLDLNEAVRQYREVSLLMKPLCRADCRGLCVVCGADLNESDCGHDTAPADDRWAGLAAFKGASLADKD